MTKYTVGEQLVNSMPIGMIGEPFTIDEIDAHPDVQRIWRTIQEVVNYQWEYYDNLGYIYTQQDMDRLKKDSYDSGFDEGLSQSDPDGYGDGFKVGYDCGYKDGVKDAKES